MPVVETGKRVTRNDRKSKKILQMQPPKRRNALGLQLAKVATGLHSVEIYLASVGGGGFSDGFRLIAGPQS